jgi:hypothetical protein
MLAPLLADILIRTPLTCWGNAGICSCWGILTLILCFYVMVDASRRDQPGCLWAIVVFFFNILGLLVYLVVVALGDKRRY